MWRSANPSRRPWADATQSWSEKVRYAGTRSEMQAPGDARVPSTARTRLPSASPRIEKGIRIGKTCNLTYFRR